MLSEGSLKVLTPGTYREPAGDPHKNNTKIDDLVKKLLFRSNSPCITQLFLFFSQEEEIFKISKRARPRDVYKTQLRDVPGTK